MNKWGIPFCEDNLQNKEFEMKKNIIWIFVTIIAVAALAYVLVARKNHEPVSPPVVEYAPMQEAVRPPFTDGLKNPEYIREMPLDQEGVGISEIAVFNIDINKDGLLDKISRARFENGTAHFYYEYKIELNMGVEFKDISLPNFRTIEGADCALQKIKFTLSPGFSVVKIARPWEDSWENPTLAVRTTYVFRGDQMIKTQSTNLEKICDVSELF